jgi:hypothetical protein
MPLLAPVTATTLPLMPVIGNLSSSKVDICPFSSEATGHVSV